MFFNTSLYKQGIIVGSGYLMTLYQLQILKSVMTWDDTTMTYLIVQSPRLREIASRSGCFISEQQLGPVGPRVGMMPCWLTAASYFSLFGPIRRIYNHKSVASCSSVARKCAETTKHLSSETHPTEWSSSSLPVCGQGTGDWRLLKLEFARFPNTVLQSSLALLSIYHADITPQTPQCTSAKCCFLAFRFTLSA